MLFACLCCWLVCVDVALSMLLLTCLCCCWSVCFGVLLFKCHSWLIYVVVALSVVVLNDFIFRLSVLLLICLCFNVGLSILV